VRILSGIQPSGALHLGNYFGMMKPAIELQQQGEALYFVADLHSMTSLFDADLRRRHSLDVALDFLACGLDPARTLFFKQSDVPEVSELTWLLSTVTPIGNQKSPSAVPYCPQRRRNCPFEENFWMQLLLASAT